MTLILSGKEAARSLNERSLLLSEKLAMDGVIPCLGLIRVGENESDIAYERSVLKRCEGLKIRVKQTLLPTDVSEQDLLKVIEEVNADQLIHGVLLFRPLPGHIDAAAVENALSPLKDVDGMTRLSLAGVFSGEKVGYSPCTPAACMEILDYYGIDLTGRRVTVIGRSMVVGRPLAMLCLQRHATVTICHTRTKDLAAQAREADILIAAAGKAGMVTRDFLREGQIILDVGINVGQDGRLCGDVDQAAAQELASAYTPVPGGVGAVTTSVLAAHVLEACKKGV